VGGYIDVFSPQAVVALDELVAKRLSPFLTMGIAEQCDR